jgi:hypothetical protein
MENPAKLQKLRGFVEIGSASQKPAWTGGLYPENETSLLISETTVKSHD